MEKYIEKLNVGITFDFIYGSARQQTIFSLDDLDYYSQERHLYSGSLAKLYLNSQILIKLEYSRKFIFWLGSAN